LEGGALTVDNAPPYFAPFVQIAGPILQEPSFIVKDALHTMNM